MRRARHGVIALAVVGAVTLGGHAAVGAPPTDDDVAAAQAATDAAALDVAGAEARLDALRGELAAAERAVQRAGTDYTDALERLDQATQEVEDAKTAHEAASAAEVAARNLLAEAYRVEARGDGFGPLSVVTGAGSVGDVVADDVARRAVDRRIAGSLAAHADARATAATSGARWEAAQASLETAKEQAEVALASAEQAYTALERLTASAVAEREALIGRLAELRNTSVSLERQRQDARDAAAEAAAQQAAHDQRQNSPATPTGAEVPTPTPTSGPTRPEPTRAPTPPPAPTPTPTPAPLPPTSGVSRGTAEQGRRAVEWARTQLGVEYQWGGTGNPGWDCSGLTSAAWRTQGVNISRSSRSQYLTVGKINYSQLRPGDLLFWADNPNDLSTIRHVAMYTGDGRMIEAPLPGLGVREVTFRWSADLMPYAGRP